MRKKINKWNKLYLSNKLDIKNTILYLNSYLVHVRRTNSYNLVSKYLTKINIKILNKSQN